MDQFHLLSVYVLFYLVLVASNASLPVEDYWHSKLPNTKIPQELQNLLQPAEMEGKNTFWDMGFNNDRSFRESSQKNYDPLKGQPFPIYGKRFERKFKHAFPNSTDQFFLHTDLYVGQKMKLHITKSSNIARFLPHQAASSIPFSSKKLPEILKQFSIKPDSLKAKIIKQMLGGCEYPELKGEDSYCPTSLESLLDFVVSQVGNKIQVLYNEITKPTRSQEYTIMGVKMVGENQVVCHKLLYPYAVYYCHSLNATKVYMAPLHGADGIKAKAVAVCHSDTSNWNPEHLAFLMLKIKPGEGTICHFIRSDTLVWTSN